MTSNIGSEIIMEKFKEAGNKLEKGWKMYFKEEAKNDVLSLLKQTVRPEFLNRIDEIVLFDPLSHENLKQIVRIQFNHIKTLLAEQGVTIDATDDALVKLSEEGYEPAFGARPLKRVLQKRILNELSKQILSGKITKDSVIMMELSENGEVVFENVTDVKIEV